VKYLVDANVWSEVTRADPAPEVVQWLLAHEASLVVDPVILGELEYGILRLPAGRRRASLEAWFSRTFDGVTCLPFTTETSRHWARLLARLHKRGAQMPIKDSLIAATALQHELTVVTRNTRDFKRAGVPVVDPFAVH